MAETNGAHVTWRELNLLRDTIEQRFDRIESLLEDKRSRFRVWMPPLAAALISSSVVLLVAFH